MGSVEPSAVVIFGWKLREEHGATSGHFELILPQRERHHSGPPQQVCTLVSLCTISRKGSVEKQEGQEGVC